MHQDAADAGAEVLKLEPASGDPLRRWTASGTDLGREDGALFRYLNAGKKSIVSSSDLSLHDDVLGNADLLVEDGAVSDSYLARLRTRHPKLVVVSITPFGRKGPWVNGPWTEFILQALCGSTASRGPLEREPLHAGGRLGEWIGGTVGAVAAAACLLSARREGLGDHVDLSILESMTIFFDGGWAGLQASLGGIVDSGTAPPSGGASID